MTQKKQYRIVVNWLRPFVVFMIVMTLFGFWMTYVRAEPVGPIVIPAIGAVLIISVLVWTAWSLEKILQSMLIELDLDRELLIFHNYRFKTRFLPEPRRKYEEVKLTEIFSFKLTENKSGEAGIKIGTVKGRVVIPKTVQEYRSLVELISKYAAKTISDPARVERLKLRVVRS